MDSLPLRHLKKTYFVSISEAVGFGFQDGDWQGQVTFGSESLKQLAQAPLKFEDSVKVSCDGESLQIGGWVVPCEWSGLFSPRITLPLG